MNEKNIHDTADILVSSGLADHGWTYVNIDDFWQNKLGKIVPRVLPKTPFMKSRAEDAKREGVVPLSGNVVYTDDFRTDHL